MIWDTIIVGAGPVGLSLAIQLGMEGKSILLLEKKPSTSKYSKAITVWPPTQEIFQEIGILQEIEKEAVHHHKIQLYDSDHTRPLLEFPLEELKNKTPFPRLLILPQYKTEAILKKQLEKIENVEIRFGAEVFSVISRPDEVEIRYRNKDSEQREFARFLVGSDGGNSTVREQLNMKMKGKTFPFKAGLADIKLRSTQNFHSPRLSTSEHLYISFYIGDNIWRIVFLKKESVQHTLGEKLETAVKLLFEEEKFEKIWESEFRLHSRIAEKFSHQNIVLAGDAAHLNSPVGGQGMNAGIIDSLSLKNALLKALKQDSDLPLKKYAEKRKKSVKKGVNRNTAFITSLLLRNHGNYAKFFFRTLKLILRLRWIRHKFLLKMTMLS